SRSVEGPRLEGLKASVTETMRLLPPTDRLRLISVQHILHEVFPLQPGGEQPPVSSLTAAGGTALYDGIAAAMMLAAHPARRRLIIAYTDGQDPISTMPIENVRDLAGHCDAVVQFVVPTLRPGASRAESGPAATALSDFATRTGGQVFVTDYAAPITAA